ncbi:MAG: glycosyltransferase family 2 protein [Beijerinckiaceae bacterium]|nr:glycosyltransferase family 2 protein [Beijerinckiaceae bacterium]
MLPNIRDLLARFSLNRKRRLIARSKIFDRDWYLANNPDVRRAGLDPFLHFVAYGDREGRSPGPLFDAAWYLLKNPEARDTGMGPLHHYLTTGAREGRDPSCFFNTEFYVTAYERLGVEHETALAFYARHGRRAWHSTHRILPPPASPAAYFDDLPWQLSQPESGPRAAGSHILFVAVGGRSSPGPAGLRQLLTRLAALPGIGLYCVTNTDMGVVDGVAMLNLSWPGFADLDKGTMLDRILRAMKFRDPRGLVCEAECNLFALALKCREIELTYHNLAQLWPLAAPQRASHIARLAAYYPPRPSTISVIVPNYNHARFLDERFESIVQQRLKPGEIIFLDDGSDDDSLDVARTWQAKSPVPFVIVASPSNSGSPFTQWTRGIERATGNLVWIAESDDSSCPHFLEHMAVAFADPDVVLAYCDSEVAGPDGEVMSPTYRFYTDTLSETKWLYGYVEHGAVELADALAIKNTIPNVSAVLFRRSALIECVSAAAGFRYCGDWAVYVACLGKGKIAFNPRALNKHRRPPGNLTQIGEREDQAVREAIAIKLSIFAALPHKSSAIWLSLAQTVFEYEIRSRSGGLPRPAFTKNTALAECIEKLRQLLANQGDKLADVTSEVESFVRDLTAHAVTLRQTEHRCFISSILHELKELDAGG